MRGALRTLSRAEKWIATAEIVAITLALAVMLVAVVLNVIDRTFNLPWPDLSEPALISMSVLAFVGSAYAVYSGGHIIVDLGEVIPAGRWRRRTAWIVDLCILVLAVLIVLYGSEFLAYVVKISERTPELDLPLWLPVGCLVGGSVLSIFHVLCRLLRAMAGMNAEEAGLQNSVLGHLREADAEQGS